jgi:hypothetical protein
LRREARKAFDHAAVGGGDDLCFRPAAKDYIRSDDYEKAGIELIWKDYAGYPEYLQQFGAHDYAVSILDLLMNTGDEAPYYIWGWRA